MKENETTTQELCVITRGVGYVWWERKKERKEDRNYWKPKGLCTLCACTIRSAHIVTFFLETREEQYYLSDVCSVFLA